MCGIFGVLDFSQDSRDLSTQLHRMGARLSHRGPDDRGLWTAAHAGMSVGLGFTRLSIIDLVGGQQPLSNEDGSVVLVCNGEIYNYRELRQELQGRGHRFRSQSDSEVLVHLYEDFGCQAVSRLRGMFAFALWDDRRRQLVLGRDRLGIKPLLFTHDPDGRLTFASELQALVAARSHPPVLNRDALLRMLWLKYLPGPDTGLQDVWKLAPGTIAVCTEAGLATHRYWELPHDSCQQDVARALPHRVRQTLESAVVSHLVSDVPVGAFLSGGLDSSAVVGVMACHTPQPFHTFSVGFEGAEAFSELPHARAVSARYGTVHHELVMRPDDVPRVLPTVLEHLEEPLSDPAILPTYLLSQQAASHVKVVLTGEGADELFGGYRRYGLDRLADAWRWVPSGFRRRIVEWAGQAGVHRRTLQALQALTESQPVRRHVAWTGTFLPHELMDVVADPPQAVTELAALVERFQLYFDDEGRDARDGMLRADLLTWLPDDLLLKVDRMSMAASLEARVPYLDHPLVELATAVPAETKLGVGGKALLRAAVGDLVPSAVLARPKQGLDLPLASWLRYELRDYVADTVSREGPAGLFDEAGVRRLLDLHLAGEQDRSRQLWTVLVVKLWCETVSRQPAGVRG